MSEPASDTLLRTPLYEAHVAAGARMVPFAGYSMPVQYSEGIIAEHMWTRQSAGLFDVSHMGQAVLIARDRKHETVAAAFEKLVPADILNLAPGQQRYTQLLTPDGGIFDDLMVHRPANAEHSGGLYLIVNAARKAEDFSLIEATLDDGLELARRPENALLALQGPAAASVLAAIDPGAATQRFMTARLTTLAGVECLVTRSGYTGEDGFEISVDAEDAGHVWQAFCKDERVRPIGLGARDSLRLEAGLCLCGHDIDEATSPVEAGLQWSIQKRRREGGGFPGAGRILRELKDGPARKRTGLLLDGRQPAREGAQITTSDGQIIGNITSGGFSPVLQRPVAMGYIEAAQARNDAALSVTVRGKALPARVAPMPFVATNYYKP